VPTTTWTTDASASALFPAGCFGVAYNGTGWALAGENQVSRSALAFSTDAATWTSSQPLGLLLNTANAVLWTGSRWAAAGFLATTATSVVATSTNGINWSYTTPTNVPYGQALGSDTTYLYLGGRGGGSYLNYSPDNGTTWLSSSNGNSLLTGGCYTVAGNVVLPRIGTNPFPFAGATGSAGATGAPGLNGTNGTTGNTGPPGPSWSPNGVANQSLNMNGYNITYLHSLSNDPVHSYTVNIDSELFLNVNAQTNAYDINGYNAYTSANTSSLNGTITTIPTPTGMVSGVYLVTIRTEGALALPVCMSCIGVYDSGTGWIQGGGGGGYGISDAGILGLASIVAYRGGTGIDNVPQASLTICNNSGYSGNVQLSYIRICGLSFNYK